MTSHPLMCRVLLSIFWLLLAFPGENRSMEDDGSVSSKDTVEQERIKRSVSGMLQAFTSWRLLRGTKRILSPVRGRSDYVKKGSYKNAVADFYKVKPTNVRRFVTPDGAEGMAGRIGDLHISVEHLPIVTETATLRIVQGTKENRIEKMILYVVPGSGL